MYYCCLLQYNIDYRGSPMVGHKWRPTGSGGAGDMRSNGSHSGSDNESAKSSHSEGLLRTASLNRPITNMNAFERVWQESSMEKSKIQNLAVQL